MLHDLLMSNLFENTALGRKIRSTKDITKKGLYALDATEKNPNIEDSLAEQIANLQNQTTGIKNSVKNIIALPNGASTGDGQIEDAKVGIEGETYDTLGDAIREQIKTYKDVSVSNVKPEGKSKVWVNTAANDTTGNDIVIPQVNDSILSADDTWSSKQINNAINNATDEMKDDILSYIESFRETLVVNTDLGTASVESETLFLTKK